MRRSTAEVIREYGPFAEGTNVGGVTHDGRAVWFAAGSALRSFDPDTGEECRAIDVPAHAGTAFDGRYLYQIDNERIHRIDPASGSIVSSIPTPGAPGDSSGLAWAEGALWVGQYRARKIHQVDPETGAILRSIDSNRFVTGVTWVDGELWHGTWEGDASDVRHIDAQTGEVLEELELPSGGVSGLDADSDRFYCGSGPGGTVRAIRRPRRS